jgi:phosphopentomutase
MKRTIFLLLDSLGIGASHDADKFEGSLADGTTFNDVGANTFGSIAKLCATGEADIGRKGPLFIPNLTKLGLAHACQGSSGEFPMGLDESIVPISTYGHAQEISTGKDTPSGHWEITGAPVLYEWGYFKDKQNSFPQALLDAIVAKSGISGYLGNCHSSGTVILDELGEEHIKTGKPIFYTSSDSVFQIACHEETYGVEALYELCETVRELLEPYNIGRVIARPFSGNKAGEFARTGNRHDYSVLPPSKTLLDRMKESGGEVVSIGKISDIFAAQGITQAIKATGLEALFDATLQSVKEAKKETIIFTNFVNFDADFGHRRNVAGYAAALEYFDTRLPELLELMDKDDLLVLSADHGCDPTWPGSDHTREHIPVIFYGENIPAGSVGLRDTFADIGQTIAEYHHLPDLEYGKSIFK